MMEFAVMVVKAETVAAADMVEMPMEILAMQGRPDPVELVEPVVSDT